MTLQTRYRLIEVNVAALLPPGDPLTEPLAVFMEATNDLRFHLGRSIIARHRWIAAARQLQKVRSASELSYAYRAMCGHLYEVGLVFIRYYGKAAARIDEVLGGNEKAGQSLAHVRNVYREKPPGFFTKVLWTTRKEEAFHYDAGRTRQRLAKHKGKGLSGRMLFSDAAGNSRYILTDRVANLLLDAPAVGEVSPEVVEFFDHLNAALVLGRNVCVVVDSLVDGLAKQRIIGKQPPEGREVDIALLDDEVSDAEKKIDEWMRQRAQGGTDGPTQ
jgi:hypothetical protein